MAGVLLIAPSADGLTTDPTPPVVTPLYSPSLPANGWYRSSVTLSWHYVDPESIILKTTGCDAKTFTVDTPGTLVTCTAESDGGTSTVSVRVKVDRTPPAVSATADRGADANGWYNHPLSVSFAGTDATSGIAGCTWPTSYGGPDALSSSVTGSCTDGAGNVADAALSFKYDATAPSLSAVATKPGNRRMQVSWRASSDTSLVQVLRVPGRNGEGQSVVYQGSASGYLDTGLMVGRQYEYRVTASDVAANRSEQTIRAIATGALLSPAPAAQVTAPPRLAWTPVKGASYYNVQLIRGRRVLSAWPVNTSFQLRRKWTYKGRRYTLQPGLYRWYVWPGKGRISATRYGPLLGSSTFVVVK